MKIGATTESVNPKLMAWDTEFWGIPVGRAEHLEGVSQWAAENTVGLVFLLVDADRPDELQRAEEEGFRIMDVRVTLDRATGPRAHGCRLARAEDTSRLTAIARTSFPLTRFYADPLLDDERCGELYAQWTRSLCAGAADIVLVAERDRVPVGYVTVNADGTEAEIGLIAVAADYRGQSVGLDLVNAAIDWSYSHDARHISVATQGRNIGALRTFGACGFRVCNTSLWLHRWYTKEQR